MSLKLSASEGLSGVNALNGIAYAGISTTLINKTIENREFCIALSSGLTITLPASPQPGWEVGVGVGGEFTDTIIERNGNNIMNVAENMTIDVEYLNVNLIYVDNTYGWKVI